MNVTSKNGQIIEITASKSEFTQYVNSKKWQPQTKVLFHKQKDGFCNCKVSLSNGDSKIVKVVISHFFYNN